MNKLFLLLATITFQATSASYAQTTLYVDDDSPGGNGMSWASAYTHLQTALEEARTGMQGPYEIRIAQGHYTPIEGHPFPPLDPREATFLLADGVILRGGYAGTQGSSPDTRDFEFTPSVLSGDLQGDDLMDFLNYEDNSIHVVSATTSGGFATLDGVTIERGNASQKNSGRGGPNQNGGGVYIEGMSMQIVDCLIQHCFADKLGGALIGFNVFLDVRRTVFFKNTADNGGGVYTGADAYFTACRFLSNNALRGGGSWNTHVGDNGPVFINCEYIANTANSGGGALVGNALFYNCIFYGNHAVSGGAMQISGIKLFNTIIAENTAVESSNAIRISGSISGVYGRNLIAGYPSSVHDPFPSDSGCCGDVITDIPLFRDPLGSDGVLGTFDDDFRPAAGSPVIDAGVSDDLPLDLLDLDNDGILDEPIPVDILYHPRYTDTVSAPDTGSSSFGVIVDLGPYEVDACQDCPGERTWQSPAGGMYAEPINWFPGVAGAGNTAVFDLPLTNSVVFDDDVTNFALRVRGQADAILDLAGNTYTLTATNENPFIAGESAIPGGFPSDFPNTRPTSIASLTLLNGMVSSETAVLGLEPLSAGSLTLRSTPTEFADWIISDDIVIGDRGYGELRLEGGSMLFSLAATIGSQPGSFGAVTLEDPATEWISAFGVSVERGNLHVGAGATVTPTSSGFGQILLFQDGTLSGDGTINGDVVNFGVVEPMPSSGVRGELSNLKIQGDYRQFGTIPQAGGSGTLRIQIDNSGVSAGLAIDGRAILAGGLVVDTNPEAGMFDPAVDDSFEILTAGLGLGESDGSRFRFDAILAPGLPDGKFFRLDDSAKRGPNGSIALKVSTLSEMDVEIETQTPTEITGGKPTDAALGDLVSVSNGVVGGPDGLPDLAIVIPNEADPTGGNGQLVILVNRGLPLGNDAFFELAPALIIELPGALNPASVSLGDLDNDKDLDIAIANQSGGTITAVINSGALGTMDVLPPISAGMARPRSLVVGDFDNDMRADVAVAGTDITGVSGKIAGLISDGLPGAFLTPQVETVGTTLTYASLGDLDNDKDLDLVVADSGTDTVHSIENLHLTAMPWPGFQARQTIPVGAGVVQASLDDLDNDGDLDLITVNRSGNSVSIALNDAGPMGLSFGPSTDLPLGLPPLSLALADLDGDDDDDLAVIISNGQKNEQRFLRIFRNDLDQSAGQLLFAPAFDSPSDLLPLIALSDIATLQGGQPSRDIDNDGDEDVLTVNENPPSARGTDASSVEALRLTCQVDLNGDMNIGSADLAILLAAWGGTGPADLVPDGVVDSADLAILLAAWGSRCDLYIDSENTR